MKNLRCLRQAAGRAIQPVTTSRSARLGATTSRLFNGQCSVPRTKVSKTRTSRTVIMSQPGVTSFPLKHALFFTASLKNSNVDKIQARTVIHSIFNLIRQRDPFYTIAFSDKMCHLLDLPALPVSYKQREYSGGVMEDEGGDIFVHLKSNDRGELQADAIRILSLIPDVILAKFEDIYGFVFDGRDLSGFIDGSAYKQPPRYRIVRQSMPYGSLSKEAGLFFIAYSKSLEAFEFMLDRMVEQGKEDGVLKFSHACTGAYWYVPNLLALEAIKP